ncbi:hypothetical protein [Pseudomonas putida]|uniref:Uncharacterized protein n=1 Tax=Pseudomonas putida TaxID=303 RepID=A0A8I1ED60_PSEPU|nr:hypothetical protein [Pseudomonas putida]MBI6883187.1 hypothetical protein [Pseudomonas putida]
MAFESGEIKKLFSITGAPESFSELPVEFQSPENAKSWLQLKLVMLTPGSGGAAVEYFEQIPSEIRDSGICKILARQFPLEVGHIDDSIDDYLDVVLEAIRGDAVSLNFISQAYKNTETLDFLISRMGNTFQLCLNDSSWARTAMTPVLLEKACIQCPRVALYAKSDQITDKFCEILLRNHYDSFTRIRSDNGLDMLARAISQGHWPHVSNRPQLQKPVSVANGARLLLTSLSENQETLYLAYLTSSPT